LALDLEPEYKSWNKEQLKEWLDEHNVNVPKGASPEQLSELVQSNWYAGQAWMEKQVEAAKGHYDNLKDAAFDTYVAFSPTMVAGWCPRLTELQMVREPTS
jgi:hypothetical protein